MPNRFLNNITINDEYTFPDADGSANQVIATDGSGELSFVDQNVVITVKNVSGGSLSKGTVVHTSPSATPPSGNVIEVIAADYDDATKMPAIGVLNENIADQAEGAAVMMGAVAGIDTSSFSIGDELYVGNLGAFTNSKPATAGQLIQKIAVVIKSHASNGLIKIFGAGRSNDVPLPLYIDNDNQRVGISEPTPAEKLVVSEARSGTGAADQTKYTLVSKSTISSGTPGTGGIKVAYDDGTNEHGFGLVSGSSSADFLTTGPMHFYTNSDLNTHSATGFAMVIDASQRVTIGNTTADGKLSLHGGNFTIKNDTPEIILKQTASTTKVSKIIAANGLSQAPPTGEIRWQSGRVVSNQPPDGLSLSTYNPSSYATNRIHLPSQTYDNFVITLDDTSVLEIDPVTENVGIGTSDPSSKLEIVDDLSAASTVEYPLTLSLKDDNNSIDQLGGEGVGIKFKIAGDNATDPGNTFVGAGIAAVREVATDADSSTGLAFSVSQNDETLDEVVRIDRDGNVGILETNPAHPLHISKSSSGTTAISSQLKIDYNSTYNLAISHRGYFFGPSNNDYRFYRDSDVQMTIAGFSNSSNYGYVGLGVTSPERDLQIKKDTEGGQVRAEVNNTSNTANSHGVVSIYTGGDDAGDPFAHWKINSNPGTDWSMGIDNSDADKLKISKNFGPGINDYLTITTGGLVGIGTTDPLTNLHISSGTSGDATVIIEADTDDNNENDLPRLWFKADGGITEGAIQLNDNEFEIISNVGGSGDIVFKTGTTNNTGTTDPATGATERARVTSTGIEINGVAEASYGNYLGYYNADPHDYINNASVFYWIKIGNVSSTNDNIKFQAEINTFGDNNYPRGSCYHVTVNKYHSSNGLSLSNYKISGSDYGDQLSLMVDSSFNIWIKRNISWSTRMLIRPMVLDGGATFNSDYTGSNRVSTQPSGTPVLKHDGAFRVNYSSSISTITHDYRYKYFNIDGDTKMTIFNSGNIGIDNTLPSFKLDIGSSLNDSDAFRINGQYSNVLFSGNVGAPTGGVGLWNFINTGTNATTRFYVQDANNSSDRLTFRFTGNGGSKEILSGTSTGYIGIGTNAPSRLLHLAAASSLTIATLQRTNDNTTGAFGALQWTASDDHSVASISVVGDGNNEGGHMEFRTTSAATNNDPYSDNYLPVRMRITSAGRVGINTPVPEAILGVFGGSLGGTSGDSVPHAQIRGDRHRLDFKEVRTANGTDWNNTTFKMQMRVDSTNHQSINFVSDSSYAEHIDIYTGNQVFNTRFKHDGNVGIGSTSAPAKLTVGDGTTDVAARVYFNDSTYTQMKGFGVEFSRAASYLRPTADNNKTLNIGQSSLQWNTIRSNASEHKFEDDAQEVVKILNYAGGNANAGNIIINSQGATGWAPGDGLGKISFHTKDASGLGARDIAAIEAVSNDGNGSTTTTVSGVLSFKTSGYNSTVKETFKLLDTGEVQIRTSSNGNGGCKINFSDHEGGSFAQNGTLEYVHADTQSYGSGNAFKLYGTEASMSFVVDGKTFSDQLILGTTSSQSNTLYVEKTLTSTSDRMCVFKPIYPSTTTYGLVGTKFQNIAYGYAVEFDRSSQYSPDNGCISFRVAGTQVGSITTSGSNTSFNTSSSDERLKKNFETWDENVLNSFETIEPKKFHFNHQDDNEEKNKGYIAQEMADKFPEAYPLVMHDNGQEQYMFNPPGMTTYLMKAVKELIEENKQLKQRVENLENN